MFCVKSTSCFKESRTTSISCEKCCQPVQYKLINLLSCQPNNNIKVNILSQMGFPGANSSLIETSSSTCLMKTSNVAGDKNSFRVVVWPST